MKKIYFLVIILLLLLNCEKKPADESFIAADLNYEGSKILIVHSYHAEVSGVITKNQGLLNVLDKAGIEYKMIYMDTKRNTDEEFKLNAALDAKEAIEEYKPDVVITFDDNAFKYLIMPYYRDSELPVVFAGIDWDISIYDAPYSNTTGMISVALVTQLIEYLREYAAGNRIAWLGYDTFTSRKETKAYQEILGIEMSTHYVTNFEEWKNTFLILQTDADMIMHSGMLASMEDWDSEKAEEFVLNDNKPYYNNTPGKKITNAQKNNILLTKYLSVPVIVTGNLIGQIALANPGRDYNNKDIDIIKQLAELYTLALLRFKNEKEKKKLEDNLRQSQKMEAIGTLAGGIAHDFNNILAIIMAYSEVSIYELSEGKTPTKKIQEILRAVERAKNLVKQILMFSRKTNEEMIPVNLSSLIREATKLIKATTPASINILVNIEKDCGNIIADPNQIHQVLINLCTNAVYALEDSGDTLEISLNLFDVAEGDSEKQPKLIPGSYIRLKVRDNGKGIEKKVIKHIFEPYFTTKEIGKGTGMGLAAVHGIVQRHKGIIKVESEPGKGTEFTVYFPKIEIVEKIEKKKEKANPFGNERILLIDDEKDITDALDMILSKLGYSIIAFNSSENALEEFRNKHEEYDIVITDQSMPVMSGCELSEKLLEINPDTKIIICTGYSKKLDIEKVKAIGIRELLLKPIGFNVLTRTIRKVLDSN